VGCYIGYSEEGTGRAAPSPSPILAVPNVTGHPLTANVPISVLLYDGPLLCGFIVAIKGLNNNYGDCASVVKIDCSKRLAFLLHDFKLISNQQQLISKTDTYAQSI